MALMQELSADLEDRLGPHPRHVNPDVIEGNDRLGPRLGAIGSRCCASQSGTTRL